MPTDEPTVGADATELGGLPDQRPTEAAPPRKSVSFGPAKSVQITDVAADLERPKAVERAYSSEALESLVPPDLEASGSFLDLRRASGSGGFASVGSSVLNLANTTLGTALFALPSNFALSGILPGVVIMALSAFLGATSLYMLALAGARIGRPNTFYSVSEAAIRRLGILVDTALLVSCLGSATSYHEIFGSWLRGWPAPS